MVLRSPSHFRSCWPYRPERLSTTAIAAAGRQIAHTVGAAAIAAFTEGGSTALRIARERPDVPVLGLTNNLATARRLAVGRGVQPR